MSTPDLRRVEVRHREPQDVPLDLDAHVADRALRRDAHDLRQRKRRDRLNQRRPANCERERHELVELLFSEDVVDEKLRADRQNESCQATHHHQRKAERERSPVLPHERACLRPRARHVDARLLLRGRIGHGSQNLARSVTNQFRVGRT